MELKLTNVARASLEELRLDYEDYLRQRGLALWARDCATAEDVAVWVKGIHGRNGRYGRYGQPLGSIPSIKSIPSMESIYPELSANAALVLIGVRQISALARAFEKEGGFTERLYRTRQRERGVDCRINNLDRGWKPLPQK